MESKEGFANGGNVLDFIVIHEDVKDHCPQGKGEKVVQEKKVLEVVVEKGITFHGEADEAVNPPPPLCRPLKIFLLPSDSKLTLQQKEHPKFKRTGGDLFVEHTLSISEALCGFQIILTHLDGRQLLIKSQPGEVVKPDQYKAINDD
ncbi:hypothetical protein CJ030_MR6G000181 [Morella rubra]|uniref:Chaperone DnaJ C-terminal domain-containing protein n=1 Tax=Morella rubra TaxID=262757 RepID=A0A6A1VAL6_9ROSI|nr:hypothetical protein CJ030_MR6G000181 [Morella rubra]